ncbi:MBL fold metallo-hydrolase [Helicobacter aurati]|uniref:hypothetical protein n=1 Tax=Helicobacter aurati TaxID=137778 RepID=UPI0011C0339C|nr:hypothetical protein [Helicobacter aurati]
MWFGHSSLMLWLRDKTILLDPLLKSSASSFPFVFQPFKDVDIFSADDLPIIDSHRIIGVSHCNHSMNSIKRE